jgi:deoxyadenosine/deoxycytidine kinase
VVYLLAKLETLKKRIAKKKVPCEERISGGYLEAMVDAYDTSSLITSPVTCW